MNSDDALQAILDRIDAGDSDAVSEIYEEYAPYLKMVVRRRLNSDLRTKFDSTDVIQSVWADLLDGFRKGRWSFESPEHLRAFLVRATRNRLVDFTRRHGPTNDKQQPLRSSAAVSATSRPSDEARAKEEWEAILAQCSEQQRPVVELKSQGFSIAEIAERTGYHPSSIRRILYDLADRSQDRG